MEQHELFNSLFKMLVVSAFLVGALWVVLLYLKKRHTLSGKLSENKKIKILETCHIGLKKSVCLVQVPGEVIVLAISGESVTFLTRISAQQFNTGIDPNEKKASL